MKNELIKAIADYMNEAWKTHAPEVKEEDLIGSGAIYYMNGNDGTDFDWNVNDHLCEFMMFYKSTEYGFIKVYVNANGIINGYLYKDDGNAPAIHLEPEKVNFEDVKKLYNLLLRKADCELLYNASLKEIGFEF